MLINKFFIKILKFYKKYLSPGIRSGCIFTPTCSIYAIEALEKHNFIVSIFLIIWRILRCNSLNKGGFDPVPDNINLKKWLY
ncbi:MAG: membrane protein insertion efficiency factor YidD [Clostridia bacterium]|nr:membrane protein insertion efficiency factor YidD [Clostridia bacterium]